MARTVSLKYHVCSKDTRGCSTAEGKNYRGVFSGSGRGYIFLDYSPSYGIPSDRIQILSLVSNEDSSERIREG